MTRRHHDRGPHDYPRTARLNELIRQIVAETVELIDDERLEMATVVAVEVDPDLRHGVVYVSSLRGEEGDGEVAEAMGEHRHKIQMAIGSQARFKRVPELVFQPDEVTRGAARIETILRDLETDADGGADADGPDDAEG